MPLYKTIITIYTETKTSKDSHDLVVDMMCGLERMSKFYDINTTEEIK